jgi:hypothetical protein
MNFKFAFKMAERCYALVAKESGFSLHAEVAAQASERDKLERLCR